MHGFSGARPGDSEATCRKTIPLEGHWEAIGAGWTNKGESLFAAYQQRQRAEEKKEAEFEWYSRSE